MPHPHPGHLDRPSFRGPEEAVGHDFDNPVRPPCGAGVMVAGHRRR